MLASFALAIQFLTRIPIKIHINVTDQLLGRSVLFYPLVGLLIGSLLAILSAIFPAHSTPLNAAIILTVWVLTTGGLHLDGLADCSDAWIGGQGNKARSLAIMKDPASGPIAVTVLVLLLITKWAAIYSLLQQMQNVSYLLLAPFMGRLSIVILMISTPYIRKNGLGAAMQTYLPKRLAVLVICISLLLSLYLVEFYIVLNVLIFIALIRFLALQRLQGVTGDVYGASVEIIEAVFLISVALANG